MAINIVYPIIVSWLLPLREEKKASFFLFFFFFGTDEVCTLTDDLGYMSSFRLQVYIVFEKTTIK